MDDLAALRDVDLDKFAKNQPKTTDPGDVSEVTPQYHLLQGWRHQRRHQRADQLRARRRLRFLARHLHDAGQGSELGRAGQAATRAGGSGKASRSADEIALVFTRNKGAIDAMYARALRDNPALQGKVVIELTIAPSGEITGGAIVSSELNDKEFEGKLLARIGCSSSRPRTWRL